MNNNSRIILEINKPKFKPGKKRRENHVFCYDFHGIESILLSNLENYVVTCIYLFIYLFLIGLIFLPVQLSVHLSK